MAVHRSLAGDYPRPRRAGTLPIASLIGLALLAVAQGVALADPAQGPPIQTIMFRCHVAPGPRLTNCTATAPSEFDPRKIDNMGKMLEDFPSCMISNLDVGSDVDRPFRFVDGPSLLVPYSHRSIITNPDWAEKPSGALLASVYPPVAAAQHLSGHAVVGCMVNADGSTRDCTVVSEAPPGSGFGDAALRAAAAFHFKPRTRDCVPTNDGKIQVPIAFTPPDSGAGPKP